MVRNHDFDNSTHFEVSQNYAATVILHNSPPIQAYTKHMVGLVVTLTQYNTMISAKTTIWSVNKITVSFPCNFVKLHANTNKL